MIWNKSKTLARGRIATHQHSGLASTFLDFLLSIFYFLFASFLWGNAPHSAWRRFSSVFSKIDAKQNVALTGRFFFFLACFSSSPGETGKRGLLSLPPIFISLMGAVSFLSLFYSFFISIFSLAGANGGRGEGGGATHSSLWHCSLYLRST